MVTLFPLLWLTQWSMTQPEVDIVSLSAPWFDRFVQRDLKQRHSDSLWETNLPHTSRVPAPRGAGTKARFKRRTLHVPNLINGQKKYHPYGLKQGNKLKKVKVTKPGYSCFDFSVISVLLWQGDSWGHRDRDIWTKWSNAINFKTHNDFFMDIKKSNVLKDRFKLSSFSLNIYNVIAGNRSYASVSSVRKGAKTH